MSDNRFIYKADRRSRCTTWLLCGLLLGAVLALALFGAGEYMPAWLLSVTIAVGALCGLSVPRFVRVSGQNVEIHCTVEITILPLAQISSVRIVEPRIGELLPAVASHGFFGYFGFYLDTSQWDMVKVYAGSMRRLVEIEDVFENRFMLGVTDPEALRSAVEAARQSVLRDSQPENQDIG